MLPLLASRLSMHGGHMICQVGILIELYVTGGADVRPPPCALLLQAIVGYHMFVHDVCFVERFGAIRAPELFLLHVCFHVIFRCVLIVEGLSIEFALVSLEFLMLLNVQLGLRSLGELPRTKVTLKWVFLCVGPHMLLQITVLIC